MEAYKIHYHNACENISIFFYSLINDKVSMWLKYIDGI